MQVHKDGELVGKIKTPTQLFNLITKIAKENGSKRPQYIYWKEDDTTLVVQVQDTELLFKVTGFEPREGV